MCCVVCVVMQLGDLDGRLHELSGRIEKEKLDGHKNVAAVQVSQSVKGAALTPPIPPHHTRPCHVSFHLFFIRRR